MERKEVLYFLKKLTKSNHEVFCTHNHADYCGWFFEINKENPNWLNFSLYNFLEKTIKITNKHRLLGLKYALAEYIIEDGKNRVKIGDKIYTAALDKRGDRSFLHDNIKSGDIVLCEEQMVDYNQTVYLIIDILGGKS